jgi:uncharacterized protein
MTIPSVTFPENQSIPVLSDLMTQYREQILALAERHGAYNVRIFGSVARGEASIDSDIDFLVDYDLDRISPWFPSGLLLDLEQLLNRKVDIATLDMLKERMRDQILVESIPL